MKNIILLFVGILCFTSIVYAADTPFGTLPAELRRFQTTTGGFIDRSTDTEATTVATAEAVSLSSLLNLQQRVNLHAAQKYLEDMRRSDGGFANGDGSPRSTIEATHAAVVALSTLAQSQPDFDFVIDFLRATITPSGFASSQAGGTPSLAATVAWLELAHILQRSQDSVVQTAIGHLKAFLTTHQTEEDEDFFFREQEGLSPVEFNSLCIRLGELIGFDFGKASKWVGYFSTLQDPKSGCFYENPDSNTATVAATVQAIRALYTLHRVDIKEDVFESLNIERLQECLASKTENAVTAVAVAHRSLFLTPTFAQYFDVTPSYYLSDGSSASESDFLIQGVQVIPILSVRNQFGPHPDFDVVAKFQTSAGVEPLELRLNPESFAYQATSVFDTKDSLGPLAISFSVRKFLPSIGQISFIYNDQKRIGYQIEATTLAQNVATGADVIPGEVVPANTVFSHTVRLSTLVEPTITSGAFTLNFQVLDSAGVVIHSDSIDGNAHADGESLSFRYLFTGDGVPPGPITFQFTVQSDEDDEVHSLYESSWLYEAKLIAGNVKVANSQLTMGSALQVNFEPALVVDEETTALSADPTHKRRFLLDLVGAESGNTLYSLPANPVGREYTFNLQIPNSLHFLGEEIVLVFKYQAAKGGLLVLESHQLGALSDQPLEHKVTVASDLVLTLVGDAPAASVHYGDSVSWSFQLSDSLTSVNILPPPTANTRAGVFLTVTHSSPSKFTSVKIPVKADAQQALSASWLVSPDSPAGQATLSIQALNGNGISIPLSGPASQSIAIAGTIVTDSKSHSFTAASIEKTSFLTEFSLSTNGKPLTGSRLVASVFRSGKVVPNLADLPVGHTQNGYVVTWNVPLREAPTGVYEVRILRAHEFYSLAESNSAKEPASVVDQLKPVTTIRIEHTNDADFKLLLPTEYFVITIFGGLTYYVLRRYKKTN